MKYRLISSLAEAMSNYRDAMTLVSEESGIEWEIIAAIMWRESNFGLSLNPPDPSGTGDHGHGRGLMQVDDRWHPWVNESDDWQDPEQNIRYAIRQVLVPAKEALNGNMRAALAAYNAGISRVRKSIAKGQGPDAPTTGHNYGSDVLNRAEAIKEWVDQQTE